MNIKQLGKQTLNECRKRGWARLETGISRPVPRAEDGKVQLRYLLYRSQVDTKQKKVSYFEPFASITVDYESGEIINHRELSTSDPSKIVGEWPHKRAAKIPKEQWPKIWNEFFDFYPIVVDAYVGKGTAYDKVKVSRFYELLTLTTLPSMKPYLRSLNSGFFVWLEKHQ